MKFLSPNTHTLRSRVDANKSETTSALLIHTDGGARGNPGPAGTGFVITTPTGQTVVACGEYIGETTNNVAEYTALIQALTWVKHYQTNTPVSGPIHIFLDSSLVVNQVQGKFKIKQAHLIPLHLNIRNLLREFSVPVLFFHVPRSQNAAADKLVNQALDQRR